jgi:hypothetical protein
MEYRAVENSFHALHAAQSDLESLKLPIPASHFPWHGNPTSGNFHINSWMSGRRGSDYRSESRSSAALNPLQHLANFPLPGRMPTSASSNVVHINVW